MYISEVMLFKHASSQLCLDVSRDGTLILSDECHTMFFYDVISHTLFDTGSGNAVRAEGSRAGARIRVQQLLVPIPECIINHLVVKLVNTFELEH